MWIELVGNEFFNILRNFFCWVIDISNVIFYIEENIKNGDKVFFFNNIRCLIYRV